MKTHFRVLLPSTMMVLLLCIAVDGQSNDSRAKLAAREPGDISCPKGFVRIPSGLACVAENITSVATADILTSHDCPKGFERPPGVRFCIAKNFTWEVKYGVILIADPDKLACPDGFSRAHNATICTADDRVLDVNEDAQQFANQTIEDGHILGDTRTQQESSGLLPGTPGGIVVNLGSADGLPEWNLLDQPGFSDYDCDSFFPTEWGWAFANNDVDVAQATFIDDDEDLDGQTFYSGSHGHDVTFIGACVGGGLYPNWNCNRVDLRIERKVSGAWNHVNTFHLAGETQDLNGGEKFTFVSTIPGYYRAVLMNATGCPPFQRVGIGVAYKDLPFEVKH